MHKHMHRLHGLSLACALIALGGAGCLRDDTLDTNRAPIANAGKDQELEFSGEPLTVTLDGSKSRDLDGKIVGYDWRLIEPAAGDGGTMMGAAGAAGGEAPDPSDERKPKLELGRGEYSFTLWVRDDEGAVSEPDTVTIKIGQDPEQECIAKAHDELEQGCRECLCMQSAACQKAIPNCGRDCWGLIGCIAGLCPDFSMTMDVSCVTSMCGQWVVGGQTGAMGAGSCVMPCAEQCRTSITNIVLGTGG